MFQSVSAFRKISEDSHCPYPKLGSTLQEAASLTRLDCALFVILCLCDELARASTLWTAYTITDQYKTALVDRPRFRFADAPTH